MHADELLSSTTATAPLVTMAMGTSPYVYTAPADGWVVVQGGVISVIELGRKGVFALTGINAGVMPVATGDQVRLTFVTPPTLTYFKR